MRAAIYARVSMEERNGRKLKTLKADQNPENQLSELREFCRNQGWKVAEEYVDRMSGKSSDRPRFRALFADGSQRKYDVVLFWALDRFSREGVLMTLNHLQKLRSWGVEWRSYREPYFDSCGPFRDAVISIMASLAAIERERISERTKAGLDRARRDGKKLGPPVVPRDPAKLAALRRQGLSLRQIAKQTGLSTMTVQRTLKSATE